MAALLSERNVDSLAVFFGQCKNGIQMRFGGAVHAAGVGNRRLTWPMSQVGQRHLTLHRLGRSALIGRGGLSGSDFYQLVSALVSAAVWRSEASNRSPCPDGQLPSSEMPQR